VNNMTRDRPNRTPATRHAVVAFAALLGVAVSLAAFVAVSDWEHRLRDLKIQELAQIRNQTIAGELTYTDELVLPIAEYIEALDHPVSRAEYLAFASRPRARHPELRSTGWAVRVLGRDREAFETAMRLQGDPNFQIWEIDPAGGHRRAGDRDEYYPIIYREPLDLADKVVGFDLGSQADRVAAMRRALAAGRPAATSAINLIVEEKPVIGLMNFAAVSDRRAEPQGATSSPAGFVYAVFNLPQVFEKVLASTLPSGLDIYFYDPQADSDTRLVHWHSSRTRAQARPFTSEAALLAGPHWSGTFKIAGRELGAIYVPTRALLERDASWQATATLVTGLAITAMIVAYLLVSLRRTRRLEILAWRLQQTTSELRLNNERVDHLAHHDTLTGLANRAQLRRMIEQSRERLNRSDIPFSVLILDLDRFKHVNDSLGHAAGDALLSAVARRLTPTLCNDDTLARLGGDEFAIIHTVSRDGAESAANVGGPRQSAMDLANRILQIFAEPFDLDGNTVFVGCSIGISVAPMDGSEPEDLMKKADLALYEAKSAGRNRLFFFTAQMTKDADERHGLEADMRLGLARGEFELLYQPIVDVWSRKMACAEALVRWRHPVHGVMPPERFISIAEETGLIAELGEQVLRQACHDAMAWPDHVRLAVNLSAVQFRSADLVDIILRALTDAGLPPRRLEIEVTETVLLEKQSNYLAVLHQLRNAGVSVALDDFGTGYSSLSYLKMFPFDKIKIDKSFIQDITERADCAAIVTSIVGLGRGLDMMTTAEGVETERQFELVRAAGVTLAQGYLFGKPMAAALLDFGRVEMTPTVDAAA
jgi:diguanylate cyclase (GGDEF)-like protein